MSALHARAASTALSQILPPARREPFYPLTVPRQAQVSRSSQDHCQHGQHVPHPALHRYTSNHATATKAPWSRVILGPPGAVPGRVGLRKALEAGLGGVSNVPRALRDTPCVGSIKEILAGLGISSKRTQHFPWKGRSAARTHGLGPGRRDRPFANGASAAGAIPALAPRAHASTTD